MINKDSIKEKLDVAKDSAATAASELADKTKIIAGKTKDVAVKSKDAVVQQLDQNGDGNVDIEDIILLGLKTPGVRVNREKFLRKEFSKKCKEEVVDELVAKNPMQAGITVEEVDKIAEEVINYERNCVSGISTALGLPGGFAMAATIPADIAQYYGYMLRAMQKLMYLYGFPEIKLDTEGETFDSETMNLIIICMGVMYGVAGANNAIKTMAKALAIGVEKKLLNAALTKGAFYPMVKKVATWFGVKMTKDIFAGFFKDSIPVVGGVVGGGLTFISFKPCCNKLKKSLRDTMLSNPNHKSDESEDLIIDEVDYSIEDADETIDM